MAKIAGRFMVESDRDAVLESVRPESIAIFKFDAQVAEPMGVDLQGDVRFTPDVLASAWYSKSIK